MAEANHERETDKLDSETTEATSKQPQDEILGNQTCNSKTEDQPQSSTKKKTKKKKKGKSEMDESHGAAGDDAKSKQPTTPVDWEKAFKQMMLKSEDQKKSKQYLFWDTQPVPKLGKMLSV